MQTEHIKNSAGRQPHPGAFNPDGVGGDVNHAKGMPGYVWVHTRAGEMVFYLYPAGADGRRHRPAGPVATLYGSDRGCGWRWAACGAWDVGTARKNYHHFRGYGRTASECTAAIRKAHDEFFSQSRNVAKGVADALTKQSGITESQRAFWAEQKRKHLARCIARRMRKHSAFFQARRLSAAVLQNDLGGAAAVAAKIAAEFGGQPGAES